MVIESLSYYLNLFSTFMHCMNLFIYVLIVPYSTEIAIIIIYWPFSFTGSLNSQITGLFSAFVDRFTSIEHH